MASRSHRFKLYSPDLAGANQPDAFAAVEYLVYPPLSWWGKVNPPRKPTERMGPQPPTSADYWRSRSRERLLRPDPLPGEGKRQAAERAKSARSYFASVASFERRRTRGTRAAGAAEWRIVFYGQVAQAQQVGGFQVIGEGRQTSPWQRVARGTAVGDDDIRAQYLSTCRRAVALSAKAHAPAWDATLGTFDSSIGYQDSDKGVIYPEREKGKRSGTWIEFRLS